MDGQDRRFCATRSLPDLVISRVRDGLNHGLGYHRAEDDATVPASPVSMGLLQLLPKQKTMYPYSATSTLPAKREWWFRECLAEMVGTSFIVLIGCSTVAAAITTGAQVGIWQVVTVWGWTVAIAIYCCAHISGAHFNPAMSLANRLIAPEKLPWRKLGLYTASQLLGATFGATCTLAMWGDPINQWEKAKDIVRGHPGSELSAAIFTEYFPNPGIFGTVVDPKLLLHPLTCCFLEAVGTALLAFVAFSIGHHSNHTLGTEKAIAPMIMGFTVAIIASFLAPLTMAGLNPARDLGPRFVAYCAGWGYIAFPGPRGGWWAYTLGPLIGAPFGALVARMLNGPDQPQPVKPKNLV